MELKIDVEVGNYLSKEDLEEEIKYAIEEYATREVNEYFKIHSYRGFIKQVASDIYWLGCAFKYLWRFDRKNGVEDLRKCRQCIDFPIEEVEDA